MDVSTNRRVVEWESINAEKKRVAAMPAWRRVMHMLY